MFEKVNPCHPDKVADQIAGALVDAAYRKEENPMIAERDTPEPQKLTLGSLFDGSGGFPLGGLLSGIVYYAQLSEG